MTANASNPANLDRIELIERSLRTFYFGVPGVIPGLGLPFAIVALCLNSSIKRRVGQQWNPAQAYLTWGATCARIGVILTVILLLLALAGIVTDLVC